jgi:ATP-dependent HslUV protease ATP-binding subunit HslU
MIAKDYLTPQQIVEELDKYIIGQHEAKRNVAIALRNRWRRMNADEHIKEDIVPNNILMIGATGVGKTEIARRLAKIAGAPFVKVEASKFTEVGYVGRDVEGMIRDLVEQAVAMVKAERRERVLVKATEAAEDIILDALIPPMKMPEVHNAGAYQDMSDVELNEKTREKFRQKIKNGELDDKKIEIDLPQGSSANIGMIGGAMDESSMIQLQEMLSGFMPKKNKKRKISIRDAKKVLVEEEAAKLIDMDEVKEEALQKAQEAGIVFIDEIDKIAGTRSSGGGPDVSREGVQRDLLPIVEGSSINTKYGVVKTDHVLFIAAGAFHVSKPSDLIPELQGRFPIRVELTPLVEEDFYKILKFPQNALTRQYEALCAAEDVILTFEDDALKKIAEIAFKINESVENIGARRLHTVMSHLLNEILFDIPDKIAPGTHITISAQLVEHKLSSLVKNRDLSQYIL